MYIWFRPKELAKIFGVMTAIFLTKCLRPFLVRLEFCFITHPIGSQHLSVPYCRDVLGLGGPPQFCTTRTWGVGPSGDCSHNHFRNLRRVSEPLKHEKKPNLWVRSRKSTAIRLIAVGDTSVSRHHGVPIEGPSETPRTSQHYCIRGF